MKTRCWHCERMADLRDVQEIARGPCAGYSVRRCPFCEKVTEITRTAGDEARKLRLTRTTMPRLDGEPGEISTNRGQRIMAFILKYGAIPKGNV